MSSRRSAGTPIYGINSVSHHKVPFDFAQGRLSPGCRRAQNDIELKCLPKS